MKYEIYVNMNFRNYRQLPLYVIFFENLDSMEYFWPIYRRLKLCRCANDVIRQCLVTDSAAGATDYAIFSPIRFIWSCDFAYQNSAPMHVLDSSYMVPPVSSTSKKPSSGRVNQVWEWLRWLGLLTVQKRRQRASMSDLQYTP